MTERMHGLPSTTVTLIRDQPAEGWLSMERYADGLLGGFAEISHGFTLQAMVPPIQWPLPRGQLLRRMVFYPFWAKKHASALYHVLDHSYGHLLFALPPEKTIITFHDLAPLLFPGHAMGVSGLAWRIALRGALRAARIITVSDFTRQELLQRFSLDPERVITIPEAVESRFHPLSMQELAAARQNYPWSGQKLLLHVGSTQPRKNLEGLIEILHCLYREGLKPQLLQVGGTPTLAQKSLIERYALQNDIHFLGKVSDDELVMLYNLAHVFVFPSLYEGFGFPTLEAMACGVPVVCSTLSSLPEVAGDAALLVHPRDTYAFAEAVANVFTRPSLADEMKQKGFARAQAFSWRRTADETLTLYRQLLS